MADNYGIFITAPGTDASQGSQSVSGSKAVLNTSNPFIKIDTQNKTGFQTVTLLITNNPPEPSSGTDAYTVLYKFKHGYTYQPCLETLFYVTTPPVGSTGTQTYFMDEGIVGQHTVDDAAYLFAIADSTYVYIICDKYNDLAGQPNNLSGTNVTITTHVFVEDGGF